MIELLTIFQKLNTANFIDPNEKVRRKEALAVVSLGEDMHHTVPVNHGFDFSAIYILYGLGKWVKSTLVLSSDESLLYY
jgi:hypothetical protein